MDMKKLGVDVLISAPQKGWSGPACCGLVMMTKGGRTKMASTSETSFALSLKKWYGHYGQSTKQVPLDIIPPCRRMPS